MQFGPTSYFVGIPGEPYSSVQVQLRQRFPGATVLLAVLCNNAGEITYMLPADKAGQGTCAFEPPPFPAADQCALAATARTTAHCRSGPRCFFPFDVYNPWSQTKTSS